MGLNQALSADARNLTQALKGSTKAQGNWGELILERVLELAGLRRGIEYDVQENHQRDDGSRAQPDVVIHLPENRHLVVDAKVSLLAYEEFASADDDLQRAGTAPPPNRCASTSRAGRRNYQQLHGRSRSTSCSCCPSNPFMLAVIPQPALQR
jgi:DNA recombination protein RmuC